LTTHCLPFLVVFITTFGCCLLGDSILRAGRTSSYTARAVHRGFCRAFLYLRCLPVAYAYFTWLLDTFLLPPGSCLVVRLHLFYSPAAPLRELTHRCDFHHAAHWFCPLPIIPHRTLRSYRCCSYTLYLPFTRGCFSPFRSAVTIYLPPLVTCEKAVPYLPYPTHFVVPFCAFFSRCCGWLYPLPALRAYLHTYPHLRSPTATARRTYIRWMNLYGASTLRACCTGICCGLRTPPRPGTAVVTLRCRLHTLSHRASHPRYAGSYLTLHVARYHPRLLLVTRRYCW